MSSLADLLRHQGGAAVSDTARVVAREFLMSWNRRLPESKIFFDLMYTRGFECIHHGECIYSFTAKNGAGV